MKSLFILIISIISFNFHLLSQNYCQCDNNQDYEKYFQEVLTGKIFINTLLYGNLQFFNDWTFGKVILTNGTEIDNKYLRYNGYIDGLLWLRKSDYKTAIVEKKSVKGFVLYDDNNEPFAEFKKIKIKNWYAGDSANIYMQVMTEGKISLYVYRRIKVHNNTNEVFADHEYYILKDGIYHNIKLGRVGLIQLFPEDKKRMRKIIWSNHLRVRKEPQLVKAIELYNKSFEIQ